MDVIDYMELAGWSAGGVASLFVATNQVTSAEARERLAQTLKGLSMAAWMNVWPKHFIDLFDSLFGKRHLTVNCFLRSSLASLLALLVLFVAFLIASDTSLGRYLDSWYVDQWADDPVLALSLGITIVGNFLPDYLSLLETRFVLSRLKDGPPWYKVIGYLVFDLVATTVIFLLFFILYLYIVFSMRDGWHDWDYVVYLFDSVFTGILPMWLTSFDLDVSSSLTFDRRLNFYTTFITSAWIWLFVLSTVVAKLCAVVLNPLWLRLKCQVLDVENQPILVLGWISAGLVLLVYAAALPVAVI